MITITSLEELESQMVKNSLVILKFSATWCGPCKKIAPIYYNLSKTYKSIVFCDIDCDIAEDVSSKFNIKSLPTFIILKDTKEIERWSGADSGTLGAKLENLN